MSHTIKHSVLYGQIFQSEFGLQMMLKMSFLKLHYLLHLRIPYLINQVAKIIHAMSDNLLKSFTTQLTSQWASNKLFLENCSKSFTLYKIYISSHDGKET